MEKKAFGRMWVLIWLWIVVLGAVIGHSIHTEVGAEKSILKTYCETACADSLGRLNVEAIYLIGLAALLALIGLFLGLSLHLALKKPFSDVKVKPGATPEKVQRHKTPAPQPSGQEKKVQAQDDQRRGLQLLCLLQREGRLVDFLEEDLALYDDAQIGAAARGIHENCQKALHTYVSPQAVIDREEGEEITIQAGFDPNAIKLTGRVTGQPPFKGILQHRGWRTSKIALPELSGTQNPNIIAPAEVEIS
jgi:hypothetical protein